MKNTIIFLTVLVMSAVAGATEFKHVGDFLLQSHFKVTGQQVTPIPMKPISFSVFTDGVKIRVTAEGDDEAHTTFEIYRSDGIGRQRSGAGALEVIPGLQAMSNVGGTLRHLRLSRESMTITTFPGVSDQTIVSHAVAAEPKPQPGPPAGPISNKP
ncbi:hypothetical protein JIN84_06720 [Luteolibacter yonseiensis]|uniref:Uncharacterized protein n=1 Tax=Luteolibacter yonseiensis TaxID=1144680 RepID=A0A934QYZ6_9BACT|nr:hypothetical protein [Luteolibacter yonseiensis]MBK1815298.1 hypothetical protein [Luteolibacter yonseiensis]